MRIAGLDPCEPRSLLLAWALSQVGTAEGKPPTEPTDRAHPRIDAWQREFGLSGVAWCSCFVGYGLRVIFGSSGSRSFSTMPELVAMVGHGLCPRVRLCPATLPYYGGRQRAIPNTSAS